ncbi:MAG: hypothetical protein CSB49_06635 [Proteobacteria bacterium]|nr:MAG: hypothetical protein CSB49_06635 [Pseudomonadota bacterium]
MVDRRDLDALRAECAHLSAGVERNRLRLTALDRRRSELTVQLMPVAGDATRLALAPLLWTLVAALTALGAAFLTYLCCILVSSPDSDLPVLLQGVLLATASLSLWRGYRPGAGGHARRVLQPTTFALIVGSFVITVGALLWHGFR